MNKGPWLFRPQTPRAQAAGAERLHTFITALHTETWDFTSQRIWYGDLNKHQAKASRWYHCSILFHPLAAIIPLHHMMLTSIRDMRPIRRSPNLLLSTRQRPGQLEDWSFRFSNYRIRDVAHKWKPLPAVCACMKCSTWGREAQAPHLCACSVRH